MRCAHTSATPHTFTHRTPSHTAHLHTPHTFTHRTPSYTAHLHTPHTFTHRTPSHTAHLHTPHTAHATHQHAPFKEHRNTSDTHWDSHTPIINTLYPHKPLYTIYSSIHPIHLRSYTTPFIT